jgi:transposase
MRGLLRGFGLKVGQISKGRLEARIRELIAGHPMLEQVIQPLLQARSALNQQYHVLHRGMLALVRHDAVCRRLMTIPGVGALVAITFTSAVDDPVRFGRARAIGAHFGLTPKRYQSGETDVVGGIGKAGDEAARTALYQAAHSMPTRSGRYSSLKRWGMEVARRRGLKRATVALARKLSVVLLRIWTSESEFRFDRPVAAAV